MIHWIHYLLVAIETWGVIYFFDSFMDLKKPEKRWLSYLFVYAEVMAAIYITQIIPKYGNVAKSIIIVIALIFTCKFFYKTNLISDIFFSALNYLLMFFVDSVFVSILGMKETAFNHVLWVGIKLLWIMLLIILRKKLPHIKRYMNSNRISWAGFAWLPLFSGIIGVYFYIMFPSEVEPEWFFSFISIGIICLNIISLVYMQESLLKEEKLRQSELQIQKKQDQLRLFHDMQFLYEKQGKKLHDYKKQLATVQGLVENGDYDTAVNLTKELTKSIAVEMSEVNTGHPVVNAVLNQEYRIAKGLEIGMILSVSEVNKIRLKDEDIVVIFGNLLDNAIHECVKIVEAGKDAVIQVKMACMQNETIVTIQNPVCQQVSIEDNEVTDKQGDGHGMGLVNVRETVERYDGSFVISCDEKEFTAVVII